MSIKSFCNTIVLALAILWGGGSPVYSATPKFFRIATGGTTGTYYPIGGLIANAISQQSKAYGVPGLVAIAQASNGSVANINAIRSKTVESAFVQADVAHWAYTGTGLFADKGKVADIRLIATLYPETIQLVAHTDSPINSVQDLKGKRVSLDEPGSGTLVDAQLILKAVGLTDQDFTAEFIKPSSAKIKDRHLDAFFIVAGYPTGSVVELTASGFGKLVPIAGAEIDQLIAQMPFFHADSIPAGVYKNQKAVQTLSVMALWVVHGDVDEDLVYAITKSLWNENTRKQLDHGHAKGKLITQENALKSQVIPLHPGAERFYREVGMLPSE